MRKDLIDRLIKQTWENPSLLLEGKSDEDRIIVEGGRLMKKEKLIAVRADTNTKHFPEHSHDYVEVVYMYQGTKTNVINGETVVLTHDCSLPRNYSRAYRVQGTKGLYMEDGETLFIEGLTKHEEGNWMHPAEDFESYRDKFEHPLWKKYQNDGVHAGHGGMDFLVLSAFAESVRLDAKPPIDVYDAATWMAVTCLSEQSIALGSAPVAFPDFTSGMWIDREPYRRGVYCLDEVCEDFFE